jgi:PAS domain S-box-containing protein
MRNIKSGAAPDSKSPARRNVVDLNFQKLTVYSYDGVVILNKKLEVIYYSQSAGRIQGWEAAGKKKNEIDSWIYPEDVAMVKALLNKVLVKTGASMPCTFKSKRADGSLILLECTFTNYFDDKDINGIVANFRDISEKKQTEDLPQTINKVVVESKPDNGKNIENREFIKTITDNLPVMIAYWDTDLICRFANKPYAEWFDRRREEMMGINKKDLLNKDEFELHKSHIKNVLQGSPQSFERTFRKADGSRMYTHTDYFPDKQDGSVRGFYSMIYDLTKVRLAEAEVKKKTEQLEDLLENINDGFIALDKNLNYTYANKQISEMLGLSAESLIGRNIWELFPDAVGSATYNAVNTALKEKKYVCNEDYYEPLDLYQENRVYPTGSGISMFIRDITKNKQEEHHLKLLESVITNTTDAVMITEAGNLDEPGPRILYLNEAFAKMTGYRTEELLNKTPRILQGPKSQREELKRLSAALHAGQSCEATIINYKKNGEEFWNNFTVSPVSNEKSKITHFIAIQRDVTAKKNDELQKFLLADVNLILNETADLKNALQKVTDRLVSFDAFDIAETWLISTDKNKINLVAKSAKTKEAQLFYHDNANTKSLTKGDGLPGVTLASHSVQVWRDADDNDKFIRRNDAKKAGLKTMYGLPLKYNNEAIGVLVLASRDGQEKHKFSSLFNAFTTNLGTDIKRKQLEQELNQVFNFAPDAICITGTDGYFKKVNPAVSLLFEYSEEELLKQPLSTFIHPADVAASIEKFQLPSPEKETVYFENRVVTRTGKIKWLSWTSTHATEEGLLFSVAKDITEKKELEQLLNKATNLARIGSWEVDLVKRSLYWSAMTKEIHEVAPDFEPNISQQTEFYHDGEAIEQAMEQAIKHGDPFDVELQIVTARGNIKWVRVIGEAEFNNKQCVRLYGSLQDIDSRKQAEILGKRALEERNIILESIDDAFFAVDKNWVVTYWNNMAERVLAKPREQTLNNNLWKVFPSEIDSESYEKYHLAASTNHAVHFEDHYAPLKKWYEISAYPSDTGLSVFFKDITDRKEADLRLVELNERLQKHAKDLADSNAELEQFAYVASHDLQEPLRMVTSFLSQLDRKYGEIIDDKGKQYIHFAVDGAKRMRQIILDLLDFSRVGRTEEDVEVVNTNKVVDEILMLYRKQIEELNAEIIVENLPTVHTYKTPVRQVFQNLISNSLKYHQKDVAPVINISYKETKTQYQFTVKDNGIGIDAEFFEKIFIIFQRLHNKDEYSGTGMGLAIAKKIVENLGGKIWVESTEGQGSTFYFTLLKNK